MWRNHVRNGNHEASLLPPHLVRSRRNMSIVMSLFGQVCSDLPVNEPTIIMISLGRILEHYTTGKRLQDVTIPEASPSQIFITRAGWSLDVINLYSHRASCLRKVSAEQGAQIAQKAETASLTCHAVLQLWTFIMRHS